MAAIIFFIMAVICFAIICAYAILKLKGHKFSTSAKWMIGICFVAMFECTFFAIYENHQSIERSECSIHAEDIETTETVNE